MENKKPLGLTDFDTAIHWLKNNYIEFSAAKKYDTQISRIFNEKYNDGYTTPYLSDCCFDEVEYLRKTFGLQFEYSKAFEKWLLIVDNFGTQWDHVECPVYSQSWWASNKEEYEFKK